MANLVKISKVYLIVGLGDTPEVAADCVVAKNMLDQNGIKYTILHYADKVDHDANCKALSTWTWGIDFHQRTLTKFPIVYWTEYFDDYERFLDVAEGSVELAASALIKNKDKVQA